MIDDHPIWFRKYLDEIVYCSEQIKKLRDGEFKIKMTKFMRIEIMNKGEGWYWRLISGNNRVLAHSEIYSSRKKAEQTAVSLCKKIKNCKIEQKEKK